jgi:hypothetical protein
MLIRMLKSFAGRAAGGTRNSAAHLMQPVEESVPERNARLDRAHASADMDRHLQILFGDLHVGSHGLLDLVRTCLSQSNTHLPPSKAVHRPLASYFLMQYFLQTLEIEGDRAECGVLNGASALLLCRAAQSRDPSYTGAGLHLIDSFEGLDKPNDLDGFNVQHADGRVSVASIKKGSFAAPIEQPRIALKDFPDVTFHRGWIPAVFDTLTCDRWSFVHLDVDQHDPTFASLGYFYPRLSRGGVIICDDYGAPMFPGAHRAWDRFCDEHDVPYVVLDTGQSVILKA